MNNFTTDHGYDEKFFRKILEVAAEKTGIASKKTELSINLVGAGRIKALNKKYRGKNKATDVLSFPLHEEGTLDRTTSPVRTRTSQGLVTSNGVNAIINLGDIFICLPVAKKYAIREGVSLDFKLAFLVIHGFLHLLGYDHEKSVTEQTKMFSLQDRILKRLALSV